MQSTGGMLTLLLLLLLWLLLLLCIVTALQHWWHQGGASCRLYPVQQWSPVQGWLHKRSSLRLPTWER
jgi:hypothetical protein